MDTLLMIIYTRQKQCILLKYKILLNNEAFDLLLLDLLNYRLTTYIFHIDLKYIYLKYVLYMFINVYMNFKSCTYIYNYVATIYYIKGVRNCVKSGIIIVFFLWK